MCPMQMHDEPLGRTPEHVARAYLDALWARRICRRQRNSGDRRYDEAFPFALLDLMQAPIEKDGANAFYLDRLRQVTVPEARQLRDFCRHSIVRDALGIRGREDLIALGAVLLFLREVNTATAALHERIEEFWQEIPETLRKDIEIARRRILGRLRFHLMTNPALRFLAEARLINHNDPDVDPGGFGSSRIGVVGYSHFGREVVLCALMEEASGGEYLRALEHLAQPGRVDEPSSVPDANLVALFDYVLVPVAVDLQYALQKRETWRPDAALQGGSDANERILETAIESLHGIRNRETKSQSELDQFIAELERILDLKERGTERLAKIKDEISEVLVRHGWALEVDFDTLWSLIGKIDTALNTDVGTDRDSLTLGQFAVSLKTNNDTPGRESDSSQRAARETSRNEAARISRPLLSADPATHSLYRGVCQVIEAMRSECEHRQETWLLFEGPEGERATLEQMLRLWFGLQLRSLIEETTYTIENRQLCLNDLAQVFDKSGDVGTGDALAVAMDKSSEKGIFGDKFVTNRNRFVKAVLVEHSSAAVREKHLEVVREHLSALGKHVEVIGALPKIEGNDAVSIIALLTWVTQARWQIEAKGHGIPPGVAAQMGSFSASLQTILKSNPCEYISDGVNEVGKFLKTSSKIRGLDHRRLTNLRAELLEYLHSLEKTGFKHSSTKRDRFITVTLVVDMFNDCLNQSNRDVDVPNADLIRRFFSMKYAKTQDRSKQEQWLYVAYKLSQTEGFEVYRQIFERVSRFVGEWRADSVDEEEHEAGDGKTGKKQGSPERKGLRRPIKLSVLYQDLLSLPGFGDSISTPLEAFFSVRGDNV